jgi:AraC-like DNA-binding protein
MNYREYAPHAALRESVECFWAITGPGAARPGRVVPDGSVEVVLSFASPLRWGPGGGPLEAQPRRVVIGQLDACAENASEGRVDYLGIRFRPAAAHALLSVPLDELNGRAVGLDALAPALDRELAGRLGDARSPAERIAALNAVLLQRRLALPPQDPAVEEAVRTIQQAHGRISVSSLVARLSLSARQLERRFRRWVGLSPKLLCRVLRFRRVFRAAERGEVRDWAGLALLAGYYDQAHLIRDFRQFAGESPARLFAGDWAAGGVIERL